MNDVMDNKQVRDAIYGCTAKLTEYSSKLSRFYSDHSSILSVRNIINAHYHKSRKFIDKADATVLINNEVTRETFKLSSTDLCATVTISAHRPMCMRSMVDYGGTTIPKMNNKLSEFKSWLTNTMIEQYSGMMLDKLTNDLLLLYRGGYTFEAEVDEDFFCVTFQSNKNKCTVTLAIEVL